MLNILIIADNSMFIRTIYNFLANDENIKTRAVFNSNDIFNGYLRYKPEIIILDNELLIPISSIIQHFRTYNWPCSFIVVKKATSNYLLLPELNYVEPTKASIYSGINNYIENISKNNCIQEYGMPNPSYYTGHYNMMISLRTKHTECTIDPYVLSQFKAEVSLLGDYEISTYEGCNFLILVKRNKMQVAFKQVHNLICKFFDENYASIYEENIHHTQLFDICKSLNFHKSTSLFLSSQCISINEITEMQNSNDDVIIFQYFKQVIEYVFNANYKLIENTIYDLYISKLKLSLNCDALNEFHNWLHFFNISLFKKMPLPQLDFLENRTNIEFELDKVQNYFHELYLLQQNQPLPIVVRECILKILESFSDSNFSLNHLEESLGYSKPYLSRTFSNHLDITIIEFLQKLRIESTRNLLESSDLAVYNIASLVGYNDAQYLSKLFNKHIGIYPTAYRELIRKEKTSASICQKFKL